MDKIDLSIVIVNWNTRALLEKCLDTVYTTLEGLVFEVVVIDNGSQDGSPDMIRERFPQVRLLQNQTNTGFACANNQAIHESQGRYVLLLNSDAFLVEASIWKMVAEMEQNAALGILGARLIYPDGRDQPSYRSLPTLGSEIKSLFGLDKPVFSHVPRKQAGVIETGSVSGACLLVRRAVLEQVGLFDEGFFMFNEEVDLCYRAHLAGWKVAHLPNAPVYHVRGGSTGKTSQRILMLYQGKRRYFAKHYGEEAEHKLLAAMRMATGCKVIGYSLLSKVNQNFRVKNEFWQAVSAGLGQ